MSDTGDLEYINGVPVGKIKIPVRVERPKKRVLVFPGGNDVGIEVLRSLKPLKDFAVFSASENLDNHAPYLFEKCFVIPNVKENSWLKALIDVITDNQIEYIFPVNDDVLLAVAENYRKIPCKVIGSPVETCQITRSKLETYRLLAGHIPIPVLYRNPSEAIYPAFIKPDKGAGAVGTHIVNNEEGAAFYLKQDPTALLLEYLPGREYTVDCFSDRERGLLYAEPRERTRIVRGICFGSQKSRALQRPEIDLYATKIAEKLELYGPWFFQVKEAASGELKLMEVAPRIGATSSVSRVSGVNLALLGIYETDRTPYDILMNRYKVTVDKVLVNRYRTNLNFDTVYIDYDDTLMKDGKVNTQLISFIWQCRNDGKPVFLLTKTKNNPDLGILYAMGGMFHLEPDQEKSDFIIGKNPIFIDDSFQERKKVKEALRIPIFDVSMVEMLVRE